MACILLDRNRGVVQEGQQGLKAPRAGFTVKNKEGIRMNARLLKGTIFLILLSISFLTVSCGGGGSSDSPSPAPPVPPAPSFTLSDLSGTWHALGASVAGTNDGVITGTINLNSAGTITGGLYSDTSAPGVPSVTGSSLSLDSTGVLGGRINVAATSPLQIDLLSTAPAGKMNASKSFCTFVSSTNTGQSDLIVLMKSGANYAQADLSGTWYSFGLSSGVGLERTSQGTMIIDAAGTVTGGTFNYSSAPVLGTINSGALTLISSGGVTGSIGVDTVIGGVTIGGIMDSSKSMGALFLNYNSPVEYAFMTIIKAGGIFSLSDLQGTWYIYFVSSGGSPEGIVYGTLQVDAAGQVKGGTYQPGSVPFSSGALSINTDGLLSGSITAGATTITITAPGGKMNSSKNTISFVGLSDTGIRYLLIGHKGS